MSRLFTSGCSFTNYAWSTWADILGSQFDQFQNWGQTGAGNLYIFNSIIEANQRHKFSAADTVVIVWTNVTREDRYIENRWVTLGNVANSSIYNKDFIANSVCERGMLIRDLALIQAAAHVLDHIGCEWHFSSIAPMAYPDPYNNTKMEHQDVIDLYQPVLNLMKPSFIDVLGFEYWYRDQHARPRHDAGNLDYHPTPAEHLHWLDTVFPSRVTDSKIRSTIHDETLNIQRRRSGNCKQTRL